MIRWLARALVFLLGLLPDGALQALARMLFSRSWRRFEHDVANPRETQLARLMLIVQRAADTEFGRQHGFADITTLEDYQAKVPIRAYDELEPYIRRMTEGEGNVLIGDRPPFYAQTSGTTGTPKFVPATPVYLAEYRAPRRVWIRQVMQAFPGLLRGKILSVHSPRIEGHTKDGTPFGSITVAMSGDPDAGDVPSAVFGVEAVPRRVFLMEDFAKKYYVLLRLAAQEDVTLAAAVNPSTLVLLADKLDELHERLARDVEAGTLEGLDDLDEPLRSEVAAILRKNPAAAARIRDSRARHGRVLPTDVWPNIVGLLCWKGGSAPFYLSQLAELYPDRKIMDYGYVATEGGFSIPLSPEGASGVVAVGAHVLEFVPEDVRAEGGSTPALLADELEIGRRYRVIVTASSGLYRYDINDVVECTGKYESTAEIAFVHKGGNMISMTGEKIGERHVVEAFDAATRDTGIRLHGFCVSVEIEKPPRYVFGVEPDGELGEPELLRLLDACEAALRDANIEYAAKRDSLRLGPPTMRVLERGAFERDRKRRVAAGAPDSHVKPLHLVRDLSRLEAFGVTRAFERST